MRTTTLLLATIVAVPLAACDYIDAATSDRPSGTQMEAVGDAFTSIGAFVKVMKDPAGADEGDIADMHATTPYQSIVDPASASAAKPRKSTNRAPLDALCIVVGETTASWDCDVEIEGEPCHATGEGTDNGDGTYSGSSGLTCAERVVTVTATNLNFDEDAGEGDGTVHVDVANSDVEDGWADIEISGLGFCLDEATPAPNTGTFSVDGLGALDGKPFDPITIEFSDTPVCGTALIAD